MKAWVDETPPEQQPMRFGNKAFRTWHARVAAKSETFIRGLLPEQHAAAWIELRPYWLDCFGHPTRIDYGTGHETSFILFLLCLSKLDVIDKPDLPAVVLRVFEQYLRLCRKLQTTYWLEPAGSHGVWSLDDYQMLPFVFGSSQLATREDLKPSCIHDDDVMEELGAENLYLQSIGFIKSVKHGGPFAEHSPMLNDISGVPNWSKVNSGMLKMYQGEVLAKRPVVQHFVFGTLLPCTWTPTKPAPRPERCVLRHHGASPRLASIACTCCLLGYALAQHRSLRRRGRSDRGGAHGCRAVGRSGFHNWAGNCCAERAGPRVRRGARPSGRARRCFHGSRSVEPGACGGFRRHARDHRSPRINPPKQLRRNRTARL